MSSLVSRYFKLEDDLDKNGQSSDSQEIMKNLLATFFPKNKKLNGKFLNHTLTKLNGILILNKPPGNYYPKNSYKNRMEIIPITVKIVFEDLDFEETILWDNTKKEISGILVFSYLYIQDLMKEKNKFDIDKNGIQGQTYAFF